MGVSDIEAKDRAGGGCLCQLDQVELKYYRTTLLPLKCPFDKLSPALHSPNLRNNGFLVNPGILTSKSDFRPALLLIAHVRRSSCWR